MRQDDYQFWVYILSSRSRTLYIGMTNSLRKRVMAHRNQTAGTFTARYNITRLIYCEQFQYVDNAIAPRERIEEMDTGTEDRTDRCGKSNLGGPHA